METNKAKERYAKVQKSEKVKKKHNKKGTTGTTAGGKNYDYI